MKSKFQVLFKKHKKHLPDFLQGAAIGELCRYGWVIFLSAWIFQGVRIMNWREVIVKYLFDIVLTCFFIGLGINWIVAFIVAHTLNFIFNGQYFAMFTHMGATGVAAEKFLDKTLYIANELKKKKFCNAAIAYGSLSRGCFKSTSDIDLRLVPAKGESNWWKLAIWAVWLRMRAFIWRYPLDMYCYDAEVLVKKMRSDELPIILDEKNGCMLNEYPERVELDEFVRRFRENNL